MKTLLIFSMLVCVIMILSCSESSKDEIILIVKPSPSDVKKETLSKFLWERFGRDTTIVNVFDDESLVVSFKTPFSYEKTVNLIDPLGLNKTDDPIIFETVLSGLESD